MKLLILSLLLVFCNDSFCQQKIELKDISKHIGDSIVVCGKIYGGKFLETTSNQPTFLNMGAPYPNEPLTLVIWGSTRKIMTYVPEKKLQNKNVCITGKVEVFKAKPQIVIREEKQISIRE